MAIVSQIVHYRKMHALVCLTRKQFNDRDNISTKSTFKILSAAQTLTTVNNKPSNVFFECQRLNDEQ
jgi:hypothetical protein